MALPSGLSPIPWGGPEAWSAFALTMRLLQPTHFVPLCEQTSMVQAAPGTQAVSLPGLEKDTPFSSMLFPSARKLS